MSIKNGGKDDDKEWRKEPIKREKGAATLFAIRVHTNLCRVGWLVDVHQKIRISDMLMPMRVYFLDLLLASLSHLHLNQFSFYCDSFFRSSPSLTSSKSKT